MDFQPELLNPKDLVPVNLAGVMVGYRKDFRIITASSLEMAEACAAHAGVTGSRGGSDFVYECAGPEVPLESRKIVAWAIVERMPRQ